MKKKCGELLEPWFIVVILLAIAHQFLQKVLGVSILLLDSYMDPLLLMPILLHVLLWEKRVLFNKGYRYTFTFCQLILYFVIISLICEFLFPRWNPLFVADVYDVICYAIGTMYFALLHNKPYLYNTHTIQKKQYVFSNAK